MEQSRRAVAYGIRQKAPGGRCVHCAGVGDPSGPADPPEPPDPADARTTDAGSVDPLAPFRLDGRSRWSPVRRRGSVPARSRPRRRGAPRWCWWRGGATGSRSWPPASPTRARRRGRPLGPRRPGGVGGRRPRPLRPRRRPGQQRRLLRPDARARRTGRALPRLDRAEPGGALRVGPARRPLAGRRRPSRRGRGTWPRCTGWWAWAGSQAGYAASKSGLVGLTRELAAQWSRRSIRVNAIAPDGSRAR